MKLKAGQQVRVIADLESAPEKGGGAWVGAVGEFVAYRDDFAIVRFTDDQIPEDARDGSHEAWFTDDELRPGWRVGQYVSLVNDEGLDLPTEHLGKTGRVIVYHQEHNSYDVMVGNGDVVYCEHYHLEPPYTQVIITSDPAVAHLDYEIARIVTIDESMGYVVAIATDFNDAKSAIENQYGLSAEQQDLELSHIDLWGDNGKICVNYVAQDAPGWSVAYAMWALHDVGYDIGNMMDTFFMP